MAAGTRVFIARLANMAVFDPNGDMVGRVRDVVVTLRQDQVPPRVLGLVVEIISRRKIFVPMGRVSSLDAGAVVLGSGTLSVRKFSQRAGEYLVISELLDRQVTIPETGHPATVLDIAMERERTHEWRLTRVAVTERIRRGLGEKLGVRLRGRRGPTSVLDWAEVEGLTFSGESQGAASLLATYENLRPADLANLLRDLSETRRAQVARELDDDRLADVLEELPEEEQVKLLGRLESERAADVLEAMDPDDAADLLAELPEAEKEHLLALMEPWEADPVRRLLTYAWYTAGGLMTPEPVVLPPDARVSDALARIREPQLSPALASQVFVCRPPTATPTGRYLGTAHFQRLLREPPSSLVSGVVDTDIAPLRPDTPLDKISEYLATYNLVAGPVVDDNGHLLGVVTVDDVLDHLLPANWRESASA